MNILQQARNLQPQLVDWRRQLHRCPEVGFDLPETMAFLKRELEGMGYAPADLGKAGLMAEMGEPGGRTVLLRADVDGLGIREEAAVEFASPNGKMHACGHDLHATMLLGAAALIKKIPFSGVRVRFYFQPAEELLQGAAAGVNAGVCDGADEAYMLHTAVNTGLRPGTVILPPAGVIAPSADYFEISLQGKGCHGADPASGVDALSVAARILLGLQHLPAREFPSGERGVVTVGSLSGGDSFNVLSDTVTLRGTFRCYDESFRQQLKTRVEEIAHSTAIAYRTRAAVSFPSGCPSLENHSQLRERALGRLVSIFGQDGVLDVTTPSGTAGSEDFAVISRTVPSVMMAIAAGDPGVGLHHPKVVFDESCLAYGVAALYGMLHA